MKPKLKTFLLLLALSIAGYAQTNYDVITVDNGKQCARIGNGQPGTPKAQSNILKNRWESPTIAQFDNTIAITDFLKVTKDNRFKTEKAVRITGFVTEVKGSGAESCNCGATQKAFTDTHIELTVQQGVTGDEHTVIVEVTPRLRKKMEDEHGKDWSSATLKDTYLNKYITVEGWLFFDDDHKDQAYDTDPDNNIGRDNFRFTCWEVHPVTSIEIADGLEPTMAAVVSDGEGSDMVTTASPSSSSSPNLAGFDSNSITNPPTSNPSELLTIILLSAILGMVGQVIRVIAGLRKARDTTANAVKDLNTFLSDNSREVIYSLLIALIIGGVAGILVALSSSHMTWDRSTIIAFIAAGYAGTDFIEGFMKKR